MAEAAPGKILAVATALPRRCIGAQELAQRYGVDPRRLEKELGLLQKAVAVEDDEHPVDFCVHAASSALRALGAAPSDLGLVIFTGTSREYLPSWSPAIEVVGRLGARRALGYDVSLGCAAALVAVELALRRAERGAPLALVVSAERWSHTLSPSVPFPLALLGHADGGAACLIGAGSGLALLPLHSEVAPEWNDFVQIPAGGTRLPASEDSVRLGQHFRTARRATPESILLHYTRGYSEVITRACSDIPVSPSELSVLVINQVRSGIRAAVRTALAIPEAAMIDTYSAVGHLGGADLFCGLERAQRLGSLPGAAGVLATSTLAAFAACGFRADAGGISIPPQEGSPWT